MSLQVGIALPVLPSRTNVGDAIRFHHLLSVLADSVASWQRRWFPEVRASSSTSLGMRSWSSSAGSTRSIPRRGILLAADGILAGLVFGRQALVSDAPPGIGIVAGVFLLASLACSVFAFANRSYETAPRADEIAHFAAASEDWIRWSFIGNVLGAIAANRNTLARKAHWLTAGQIFLLVSLAPLGGYFVYHSIRKVV